ncbi:MAG: dihydrolipoyl dehydrogenase family protein [Halobacteriota archaeon]
MEFDVIVIGSGAAGLTAAYKCNLEGKRVAVIDSGPIRGTCALRGCDPKKVLYGGAEFVDFHNRMKELATFKQDISVDWNSLMQFKRTFTDLLPREMEQSLKEMGIHAYHGKARFLDESTIGIANQTLSAEHIVVATGAKPLELKIPGEELLTTSDQFLNADHLPQDIIFVGGGFISFEFANIAARAGSSVTILHRSDNFLKRFDPDLVKKVVEASAQAGINIIPHNEVKEIVREQNKLKVITNHDSFSADMVVHGAGRVANLDLDLDKGNIKTRGGGIAVNKYMQSISNPIVYAAGDCTEKSRKLTPIANIEGDIAATNILNGNTKEMNYTGIPAVVFTFPPLGSVGTSEGHQVVFKDQSDWYTAKRIKLSHAASKIIIDEEDKIVGAHYLGPDAQEIINFFSLAIRMGLTASQLKELAYTFAYPSTASFIRYMLP